MPRIVRNFWIEVDHQDRVKVVATGPKSHSARMKARLLLREKGQISNISLAIECVPFSDEKGVRKNRVIVYFDGSDSDLEKVEVRPQAKQMGLLLEA